MCFYAVPDNVKQVNVLAENDNLATAPPGLSMTQNGSLALVGLRGEKRRRKHERGRWRIKLWSDPSHH